MVHMEEISSIRQGRRKVGLVSSLRLVSQKVSSLVSVQKLFFKLRDNSLKFRFRPETKL